MTFFFFSIKQPSVPLCPLRAFQTCSHSAVERHATGRSIWTAQSGTEGKRAALRGTNASKRYAPW